MFSTALDACCEWRANRLRHIHRALETFCTSRRRSLFIFRSTSQSELQKALSGTKLNLQFIHTRKHIHSLIEVSRLMAYSTGCCRGTTGWNKQFILRGFKSSDDAFRLSYSITFDCSIRPFLDLFHLWLSFFFPLENITSHGLPSAVFSYVDVWELSPSMKPGISTPSSSSPPISITSLQQTYSELHFHVSFRLLLDLPCGFFLWVLQPKYSMK